MVNSFWNCWNKYGVTQFSGFGLVCVPRAKFFLTVQTCEASVSHETFNTNVHKSLYVSGIFFAVNLKNIFEARWHNYPHFLVNHTQLLNNKNVISHTANPLYSPKQFRFIHSKNLRRFQRRNIWPLMHIQKNMPKSRKTVSRKELKQLESNVSGIVSSGLQGDCFKWLHSFGYLAPEMFI